VGERILAGSATRNLRRGQRQGCTEQSQGGCVVAMDDGQQEIFE